MNHTGIDKVTYGVADMDAGTKFWTDFGLAPVDTGNGHTFAAQNGAVVELRPVIPNWLPVGDDVNATVREAMFGVRSSEDLQALAANLSKTAMSAKMRMAPFTPSIRSDTGLPSA